MFDKLKKKMKKQEYADGGMTGTHEELKYAEDVANKKPEVEKGKFGSFFSNVTKHEDMHDTVKRRRNEKK